MDTLEEKYLKLLAEFDNLKNDPKCQDQLQSCNTACRDCMKVRGELVQNIKKLYSSWFPPKVYSFLSTMKSWIKTGFKKSEFADVRYSICQKCDHFNGSACNLCGCFMKGKTKIAAAACPISKWKAEDPKETED